MRLLAAGELSELVVSGALLSIAAMPTECLLLIRRRLVQRMRESETVSVSSLVEPVALGLSADNGSLDCGAPIESAGSSSREDNEEFLRGSALNDDDDGTG